jgi:hypothetical protein
VVTFTAELAAAFVFDHWRGAVSGSSPIPQITLTGDETVSAHFRLLEVGTIPFEQPLWSILEQVQPGMAGSGNAPRTYRYYRLSQKP